jgi:hypothetical protein
MERLFEQGRRQHQQGEVQNIVPESDQTASLQAHITPVSESTKTIPAEHRALINALNTCAVAEIRTDPSWVWLRFEFTSTIGGQNLSVKLFNPIIFKLSRTLDDEGLFVVGEAELTTVEDGGKSVLSRLDYCFRTEDNTAFSYESRSLIHFRIEGDVCIDVVAETYEIKQETT